MTLVKQPAKRVAKSAPSTEHPPHARREALKKLWSASENLPPPPIEFDPEKIYRIKLNQAVVAKDHSFPFRPSQDVQVRGDVAEGIREYIIGAVVVG